jgi:hypothetical protein
MTSKKGSTQPVEVPAAVEHREVEDLNRRAKSFETKEGFMIANKQSPRITEVSWGSVKVEGQGQYKDAKLYPGGSREWNWRETGTNHTPGVQPADVQELLENGAKVIVLSTGHNERLKVKSETINLLKEKDIAVHVLPTDQAVKKYNDLRTRQPVGALIHSTC